MKLRKILVLATTNCLIFSSLAWAAGPVNGEGEQHYLQSVHVEASLKSYSENQGVTEYTTEFTSPDGTTVEVLARLAGQSTWFSFTDGSEYFEFHGVLDPASGRYSPRTIELNGHRVEISSVWDPGVAILETRGALQANGHTPRMGSAIDPAEIDELSAAFENSTLMFRIQGIADSLALQSSAQDMETMSALPMDSMTSVSEESFWAWVSCATSVIGYVGSWAAFFTCGTGVGCLVALGLNRVAALALIASCGPLMM